MQIDFHHTVTYVCARLAGFDDQAAQTIAYAAQYVDDATNSGLIRFDNGALFRRISSAHKLFDYRNFQDLANYQVWLPFHFLPGNGGLPAGQDPAGGFIEKLICRANSPIAQELVAQCISKANASYGLHWLGITLHVYADTWAHQGFAGVNHQVNQASRLLNAVGQEDVGLLDRLKGYFIGEALPLGHGAVLGNPDKPYLRWAYTNGCGEAIQRDNPQEFIAAVEAMVQVMQRFRLRDAQAIVPGLDSRDRDTIYTTLTEFTEPSSHKRHRQWLARIASGYFSFGAAAINYIPKGKGSWKHQSLGTEQDVDRDDDVFTYSPTFLKSDWKLFHDALQAHHFYVIHELLPQYGICVA
ncbi:MAG: hypothetical protein RLZZ511_508 [Cyanobacteriota bacterium]|jgi:hypothetical protein